MFHIPTAQHLLWCRFNGKTDRLFLYILFVQHLIQMLKQIASYNITPRLKKVFDIQRVRWSFVNKEDSFCKHRLREKEFVDR